MTLRELLDGLADVPALLTDTHVSEMTLDSRHVQAGSAFVALAGATTHGLQHADAAVKQGAACVLFEPPAVSGFSLPTSAVPVPELRRQLGSIADRFYDQPSARLTMIGVTGTNGKTSTVQLLAQALDGSRDGPAGSLGTLGMGFAGSTRAGERTTPDVISVHAALAELSELGARAVAMEVSSHALDQGRVDAVAFDIAVFSNLTRDHLDYHGDMERYGAAKARLFDWPTLRAAVVNIDDPFGRTLCISLTHELDCWTVSAAGDGAARLRAAGVRLDSDGLTFELVEDGQTCSVSSRLLGRFNVDNLLAVAGSLRALGWSLSEVAERIATLTPVAGRMNRIDGPAGSPLVVVDYAHTPDALVQALDSLRAHASGRIICVFGCGGDRDRGKRPQMAQAVAARADVAILTDDNPRYEDGDQIIRDTLAGFANPQQARVERDRERAIARALSEASQSDIVLIAGKGHENYQEVAGETRAFDDAEVARRLLAQWNRGSRKREQAA
jgi:UDP-N-acetylmuramoyl-L-alanyl-D-glutamate--2,6-diaminopimelate ligase